jgi:hypothetical protein
MPEWNVFVFHQNSRHPIDEYPSFRMGSPYTQELLQKELMAWIQLAILPNLNIMCPNES